uniref:Acetyl-coenzyme A carboxylase carboxyl transferase subunit beta, chloroplastic n=1 Tax=Najas flexilis TaxID=29650 RepID=S4TBC9_9LILI|nr:acetyl-CoA carboxylase beta subunit [Najas flexilis]AFY64128.1 acetyl-CoA carboxylase beta subunit [Najas flexilis]
MILYWLFRWIYYWIRIILYSSFSRILYNTLHLYNTRLLLCSNQVGLPSHSHKVFVFSNRFGLSSNHTFSTFCQIEIPESGRAKSYEKGPSRDVSVRSNKDLSFALYDFSLRQADTSRDLSIRSFNLLYHQKVFREQSKRTLRKTKMAKVIHNNNHGRFGNNEGGNQTGPSDNLFGHQKNCFSDVHKGNRFGSPIPPDQSHYPFTPYYPPLPSWDQIDFEFLSSDSDFNLEDEVFPRNAYFRFNPDEYEFIIGDKPQPFEEKSSQKELLEDKSQPFEEEGFEEEVYEEEAYEDKPYQDRIASSQRDTGLTEAIQTGIGKLNGITVAIGVMDFQFIGGSMGSVVGEKITRLIEYAANRSLPLIIVCASGGARMQEGSLSLMQMAKISSASYDYQCNKKLFYVSILTSPTTGGVTASFGMLGDIIITEPGASIAFAGKRVIEQTLNITVPEGIQEAEYLFEKGLLDSIVPRNSLKATLGELLQLHGFFPTTSILD